MDADAAGIEDEGQPVERRMREGLAGSVEELVRDRSGFFERAVIAEQALPEAAGNAGIANADDLAGVAPVLPLLGISADG